MVYRKAMLEKIKEKKWEHQLDDKTHPPTFQPWEEREEFELVQY